MDNYKNVDGNVSCFHDEQEPVCIYMRYSSDGQKENSIDYQRKNNISFCVMKNYRVVNEYIDRACTGTNTRREGFQKLVEDAQNHPEWKKILVYKYNRIFRNDTEATYYRDFFRDLGIEIVSVILGESVFAIDLASISYIGREESIAGYGSSPPYNEKTLKLCGFKVFLLPKNRPFTALEFCTNFEAFKRYSYGKNYDEKSA